MMSEPAESSRALKDHFEGVMGYYKNYTTSEALKEKL